MEISLSMHANASSSVSIRCARLVSGPIAMSEHRSSLSLRRRKELALSVFNGPSAFSRKLSPRPSRPWVSNASVYGFFNGLSAPIKTGTSSLFICFSTLRAFSAPICTGAFPHTTVMPTTSISFAVNAIMMARLSSMPGSQSMMTFFLIQHPFFQKKTLQRKTSQSHDMFLHM